MRGGGGGLYADVIFWVGMAIVIITVVTLTVLAFLGVIHGNDVHR